MLQHTNDGAEVTWDHEYSISLSVVNADITTWCIACPL